MTKRARDVTDIISPKKRKCTTQRTYSCSQCLYKSKYPKNLRQHLWLKHNVASYDQVWHQCSDCEFKTKTRCGLVAHVWRKHDIDLTGKHKWFECGQCQFKAKTNAEIRQHRWHSHDDGEKTPLQCPQCKKTFKGIGNLNDHLWRVHAIQRGNKQLHLCSECEYAGKRERDLKLHRWRVHNISFKGAKVYECPDCSYSSKEQSHIRKHTLLVHNASNITKWFNCDQCLFKTPRSEHLRRHVWAVHQISLGTTHRFHECSHDGCTYQGKTSHHLNQHKWHVHDDDCGKYTLYECSQKDCGFQGKTQRSLQLHLWAVHDVNTNGKFKWFYCDMCDFTSKIKCRVKAHTISCHDVGVLPCPFCCSNVAKLIPYKDKNNCTSDICRKCFQKVTGRTSRAEELLVKAITKHPKLGPFIVLQNKKLKGHLCQSSRRPDIYLNAPNLHVFVECDEHQHLRGNYTYECEKGRMHELCDEVQSGNVLFIRWNPDEFRYNAVTHTLPKPKKKIERIQSLLKYLSDLIIAHSTTTTPRTPQVHYLYYSVNNPLVIPAKSDEFIRVFV